MFRFLHNNLNRSPPDKGIIVNCDTLLTDRWVAIRIRISIDRRVAMRPLYICYAKYQYSMEGAIPCLHLVSRSNDE